MRLLGAVMPQSCIYGVVARCFASFGCLNRPAAVSIPEHVFEQAERVARSRGWTRSYLYTEAVRAFMEQLEDDPVTSALDALADELAVEPVASRGRALIDSGAWQW